MRTKDEIREDSDGFMIGYGERIIIELLVDIRDILLDKQNRG